MAAVIAWSDSDYRLQDSRYGQVAELSLDRHTGRAPSPAWRRSLLTGEPLRQPLPPRGIVRTVEGQPIPVPKIYQADANGVMAEVGADQSLRWSR
jgi:hypothetical protein